MNKFSFKFYLNELKTIGDKSPIYLRIIVNRQKSEIATGFLVIVKDWDSQKQRTFKNIAINQSLNDIESKLYDTISYFKRIDKSFTANDLKQSIVGENVQEPNLLEYFQKFIDRISKGENLEKSTLKSYDKAKQYLSQFIEAKFKRTDILLSQVDYSFISDFDTFLVDAGLQRNTITKHEKKVKSVLLKAQRESLLKTNPYQEFKLKSTQGKREFLTQEEIEKIVLHPLGENESLKRVRDIFIFSVYTGLRFTDAISLTPDQIKQDNDGSKFLIVYQIKTTEPVVIPLLPQAQAIIDKYANAERLITGKLLPKISNQKLNSYLKTIADLTGIEKPLTHHIARHTCATTILLSNNFPIEAVSKWLGHNSIKTTQIYAKISNQYLKELANKLSVKN